MTRAIKVRVSFHLISSPIMMARTPIYNSAAATVITYAGTRSCRLLGFGHMLDSMRWGRGCRLAVNDSNLELAGSTAIRFGCVWLGGARHLLTLSPGPYIRPSPFSACCPSSTKHPCRPLV